MGMFDSFYIAHEGRVFDEELEALLARMRERWRDTGRLRDFLVEHLFNARQEIERLNRKLGRVVDAVQAVVDQRAGKAPTEGMRGSLRLALIGEERRLIEGGTDPIDVIAGVLADQEPSNAPLEYAVPLKHLRL